MPKEVSYYDYCRRIRRLKEVNGINKSLKMLLLDLADMHGENGKIFPNNKTLAENNCISEKSIDGLLSRARKNNLIKTSPARKGQKRFITLLCPDDGQPIFLHIRKKNRNNFANTQKSTFYINDKIKEKGSSLPVSLHWNGFLTLTQKNDFEKFESYLNMSENEWLDCDEFVTYLNRNGVQLQ